MCSITEVYFHSTRYLSSNNGGGLGGGWTKPTRPAITPTTLSIPDGGQWLTSNEKAPLAGITVDVAGNDPASKTLAKQIPTGLDGTPSASSSVSVSGMTDFHHRTLTRSRRRLRTGFRPVGRGGTQTGNPPQWVLQHLKGCADFRRSALLRLQFTSRLSCRDQIHAQVVKVLARLYHRSERLFTCYSEWLYTSGS